MAQLPPTSKPEATCVYIRSYSQGHGSQGQKKESQDQKKEKKSSSLQGKKHSLHFGFLIG